LLLAVLAAVPFLAARPTVPPPPALRRPPEPVRPDPDGEPLPARAIARAGTLRFRHGADVNQVVFSPDGRIVYTACHGDKLTRALAIADGRELRRFGGDAGQGSVAISADGKRLATGEAGNLVRVWDAFSGREVRRFKAVLAHPAPPDGLAPPYVQRVRVSPNGTTVVAWYRPGPTVIVWDIATGKEIRRLSGQSTFCDHLSGQGEWFTMLMKDRVRVMETATGREAREVELSEDPGNGTEVSRIALAPDGRSLVTSSHDKRLRSWDLRSGKKRWMADLPADAYDLAFSRDGAVVAVACWDLDGDGRNGFVLLVNVATGKELQRIDRQGRSAHALAFSPDGKTLATGGTGHTLRLWDVATGKEVSALAGHPGPITTTSLSGDGRLLATCSDHDRVVRLWDTATGREIRRIEGHDTGVDEVALSPDGRLLASATADVVHVSDTSSGRILRDLERHAALGPLLRFSDDGKTLATASHGNTVAIWDCATGKRIREMPAPPGGLAALLTFHDGRLLGYETPPVVNDEADMAIHLWDVTAHRLVRRFAGHPVAVASIILSPDGRMLASRGPDKTIRVWEVATGGERCRFQEPGDNQNTMSWTGTQFLAFSPDRRMLVSGGSDDPFARRWDLATGKEMPPLTGHRSWIGTVEFSASGRFFVTGSQDTSCLVWDGSAISPPLRLPVRLADADLARCWDDLRDPDAAKAYRAVLALAGAGDQATAWIGAQVKPTAAVDRAAVARSIDALDDPQFAVRERATAALMRVANQAEDALRGALERTRSPEVQRRIGHLLDVAYDVAPTPDRLLELRAVEALEMIGTSAARERLLVLAGGPAGANLTREARAAVRRLQ
jgi:WD40 repeat protein